MRARRERFGDLTERQRAVYQLVARGHTNGEIAEYLGISLSGAKWHVSELLTKFEVNSREDLIAQWDAERGILNGLRAVISYGTGAFKLKAATTLLGFTLAGVTGLSAMALVLSGDNDGELSPTYEAEATPWPAGNYPVAAYEAAADFALTKIREDADNFVFLTPLGPSDLRIGQVRQYVDTMEVLAADNDTFWQGGPEDVWYFEFTASATLQTTLVDGSTGIFDAEILVDLFLRDGTWDLLGDRTLLTQDERNLGGGGSVTSKTREEQRRLVTTPATDIAVVAWLDGVEGGTRLNAYRNLAGGFCTTVDDIPLGCQSEIMSEDVMGDGGMIAGTRGGPEPRINVTLWFPKTVARFEIREGNEAVRSFDVLDAPGVLGLPANFGFISLQRDGSQVELASFDVQGNELARFTPEMPLSAPPPSAAR